MNSINFQIKKYSIKSILLAVIIIVCTIPKELTIVEYASLLYEPFGNRIGVSITFVVIPFLFFFKKKSQIKIHLSIPVISYFVYCIFSFFYLVINKGNINNYLVGLYYIVIYLILFLLLVERYDLDSFEKGLNLGFRTSLLFQTSVGLLYMFSGYVLPFIGNESLEYRNGIPRMLGTLNHPGPFSLYIAVITLYFICRWLFSEYKKGIFYGIIGLMDIYLSGARTMTILTILVMFILLDRKFPDNIFYKIGVMLIIVISVFWFFQSDYFYTMFVNLSIIEMFQVRTNHWSVGLQIIFRNITNFLTGVGFNNHVNYMVDHYSEFRNIAFSSGSYSETFEFSISNPIHNSYLIAGAELGIFGLFFYTRIFFSWMKKGILLLKKKSNEKFYGMFVLFSFVLFAVYAMQGWAPYQINGMVLLVLLNAYIQHIWINENKL